MHKNTIFIILKNLLNIIKNPIFGQKRRRLWSSKNGPFSVKKRGQKRVQIPIRIPSKKYRQKWSKSELEIESKNGSILGPNLIPKSVPKKVEKRWKWKIGFLRPFLWGFLRFCVFIKLSFFVIFGGALGPVCMRFLVNPKSSAVFKPSLWPGISFFCKSWHPNHQKSIKKRFWKFYFRCSIEKKSFLRPKMKIDLSRVCAQRRAKKNIKENAFGRG